jgi:peptidoglycan/xylan/chitin deacetylase (PgdA/CDA1 family)
VLVAVLVVVLGSEGGRGAVRAGSSATSRSPARRGRGRDRRRAGSVAVSRHAVGTAEIRRLIRLGLPVYCAGARGNAVAFTFDDGPGPYTRDAIRKLAQAGERATFFAVGKSMDAYPGWVRRELKVAVIGDHTYTHPELIELSPSMITSELERTKLKIEAATGQLVDLFRPPYALHNPTVDAIAKRLGLLDILWNVDSQDSLGANYAQIIRNVEAGLHPGSIIIMHENRGQTIRALTTLLPALHRRHLRSVSVPQLLASDPPSVAQVRKGSAGCLLRRAVSAGTGN